jgi:hypothetical protein
MIVKISTSVRPKTSAILAAVGCVAAAITPRKTPMVDSKECCWNEAVAAGFVEKLADMFGRRKKEEAAQSYLVSISHHSIQAISIGNQKYADAKKDSVRQEQELRDDFDAPNAGTLFPQQNSRLVQRFVASMLGRFMLLGGICHCRSKGGTTHRSGEKCILGCSFRGRCTRKKRNKRKKGRKKPISWDGAL